ncbi:MAG: CoA transferase [Solirubrobacterales bacterium]|nr:CoA transferase [Solirubrobacterales bacterium]
MGVLDGILVADFSRVLAGPLASMTLGDLGADVVKVEPPEGDDTRAFVPPADDRGRATYYLTVNRNKRSVVLDLKDEGDLALARELADRADILIENYRPDTMGRFGLDYDSVSKGNPGIVYCSISGFGENGGRHLPGFDPLVEAVSGLMSVTGQPDGEPTKVGVAVVDVMTGQNAVISILAALLARDETGRGQKVSVNLLSTALAATENHGSSYLATGISPSRTGNVHSSVAPFETFSTSEGPMMVCAGNQREFAHLLEALELEELADDERFRTNADRVANRDALHELISAHIGSRSRDDWVELFHEKGVPAGPVNSIEAGFELAEKLGLDPIDETDGTRSPASPLGLTETPTETRSGPPGLDEHGDEIRAWLGGS